MKELIIYIAQSGICIGIFLLVYRMFLRSTTFFRFNRAFLLIGLLASFIIPSIRFSYDVILPVSLSASATHPTGIQEAKQTSDVDIWLILSAVYMMGIAVQLVRNFAAYRKLLRLLKSGEVTQHNSYKLVDNTQIKSPFTVLNCIAINTKCMTEVEKDLIIKHEITHIYQKHWIDLLGSECALLLQWFNPLMWFYVSSQKENHEFLADKAVIDSGISPVVYQAALINQRFQGPVFSFSNSFNYSNQLNRLFMIKRVKTSSWRKVAILALIPSFGLFFWASATPRYILSENFYNLSEKSAQDSTIRIIGFANTANEPLQTIESSNKNTVPYKALYIIDNEESSVEGIEALDPNEIESVSVLKDQFATEAYGSKGKNGVIIITTKKGARNITSTISVSGESQVSNHITQSNPNNQSATTNVLSVNEDENGLSIIPSSQDDDNAKADIAPLVFVEGKEVSNEILQTIDPNKIEQMEVLKGDNAEPLYGIRGKKNGVILITLKK